MNKRQSELQVIKTILKMGAKREADIQSQLGLTPQEFEGYRRYLIRKGLVNKGNGNGHIHALQPTSSGEALVRLIDKLDSVAMNDEESRSLDVEERLPMPIASDRVTTAKLLRGGLLRSYVLEQAELVRLETQLRYGGENGEMIEETEAIELVGEVEGRRQKLTMIQDFINILPNLIGPKGD